MKRYILLVVVLLVGCEQISASLSPKSEFIKSMEGRWEKDKKALNAFYEDGNLVMLDDAGNIELLTPFGELDLDNKLVRVKLSSFETYGSHDAVLYKAAKLVCEDFALKANLAEMSGQLAVYSGLLISDASDCINRLDENLLPEKLKKVKESLHEEIHGDFILFNSSKNPDKEVRLGLKGEDGTQVYNLNFVRKLNPEEKKIESYATRLVSRNALVDKAIGEIIAKRTIAVPVEKNIAVPVSENETKEQENSVEYPNLQASAVDISQKDENYYPKSFAVTNENISLKGLSIGMTKEEVIALFPQIKSRINPQLKYSTNWKFSDSLAILESKNDISCANTNGQTGICNEISIFGEHPNGVYLSFVGNKLINIEFNFPRGNEDANGRSKFYNELTSALSKKYQVDQKQNESSGGNSASRMYSYADCGWLNKSQNVSISIADYENYEGEFKVGIQFRSLDFNNMVKSRDESTAKFKSDAKSKAEAEMKMEKESDL